MKIYKTFLTWLNQKTCTHVWYWMRNLQGEERQIRKVSAELWCPYCRKWKFDNFNYQIDGKDYRP